MLLVENPGFVSGGSTQWWAATQGIPQAELFGLAALAPPGSDGALFLPTLSGSTAPRWNGRMRGCFAGLALSHDAAHLARAVLEGCAYALRDIVDRFAALEPRGRRDPRRRRRRALARCGCRSRPTSRTARCAAVLSECATSAGAAMLAGVADGAFADLDEAAAASVELAAEPVTPARRRPRRSTTSATRSTGGCSTASKERWRDASRPPSAPDVARDLTALRVRLAACAEAADAAPARARRAAARPGRARPASPTSSPRSAAASGDVALLADRRQMAGAARRGQGLRRGRARGRADDRAPR